MRTDRLLRLADELENLPECFNFNLAGWLTCPVGVATQIPEFVSEGFIIPSYAPVYSSHHGWAAVQAFFEIDRTMAHKLFDRYSYETDVETLPQAVAQRIRKTCNAES